MVSKILGGISIILAGILIFAGTKDSKMHVERQIVIKASPEVLFPYINNSQKADEWMPWIESDPEIKMTYSGPTEGVGSKATWNSTGQMGFGEAEVIESVQNEFVKTKLTYTKPMNMSQIALISLSSLGEEGTVVKWSVSGENSYLFKLMGVFMDCDKMIGGEFEKGLLKLKQMAEQQ